MNPFRLLSHVLAVGTLASATALAALPTIQPNWLAYAGPQTPLSDQQIGELQEVVFSYSEVYSGLWADPQTHVVTIYAAPGPVAQSRRNAAAARVAIAGTSADPMAGTQPKKWTVRFLPRSGPSLATLESARAKVSTAQPWAADAHSSLVRWYIDQQEQKVVIGLDHITPTLLSDAQKAFGNLARLTIAKRSIDLADRMHDVQPWKGGDHTYSGQTGGVCSTGFAASQNLSPNDYGMLMAGHCYLGTGTIVQQGDSNGTWGNIGQVTVNSYGVQGSVDAEFVDSTALQVTPGPQVWYGPSSNPSGTLQVHSYGSSVPNLPVCFDGAVTGENCTGVVDAIHVCDQNPGGTSCYLTQAHSSNGSYLAQPGDSGGPVETHDGQNGVTAYGMVKAVVVNKVNEWYYTEIADALSALNVTLVRSDQLFAGQSLRPGQFLLASNAQYSLIMQGDGNLVLYSTTRATWNSGTQGHPDVLYTVMQGDGNLVIYKQGGIAIWNSHTQGNPGAWLAMQGDGNLVIYKQGGIAIWHRP
jgi:hypothetical protein